LRLSEDTASSDTTLARFVVPRGGDSSRNGGCGNSDNASGAIARLSRGASDRGRRATWNRRANPYALSVASGGTASGTSLQYVVGACAIRSGRAASKASGNRGMRSVTRDTRKRGRNRMGLRRRNDRTGYNSSNRSGNRMVVTGGN
jgi:hypothetical protein